MLRALLERYLGEQGFAVRAVANGAGLGLAIAERIARLHRGSLSLHNRAEGGLEARLSLPLR